MPQTHLWNVVVVKVVSNFLCAFCASKNASNNYHMSLSSQQAPPSRKTNRHPKIDFLWLSHHCLPLFVSFYDSKVDQNKISRGRLCPSKKASLWSFQKIRIGTSLTSKAAKISRVQPCLICWPFSSCAKVMLGNTANTCHHGPQHSLEFTMPAWSVWFKPYSTTWNASRQAARIGSSRCWSHM